MIRRPPRSTLDRSSAASDVYKRQEQVDQGADAVDPEVVERSAGKARVEDVDRLSGQHLSLIHISEPTRPY